MTTEVRIDAKKNCRGVGCPMNLVHAKVGLAALEPGQVLEIILDHGPPVNNVPASVEQEGHTVLDRRRLDDGSWSVLVRKAAGMRPHRPPRT
ncbi:sulfurtransferase TusA family protein [Thermodesulfobacteriota bacterium B35]